MMANNLINTTSQIKLSANAVRKNVQFVKKQLQSGTQLSAVVKGNAYGHGIEQMVPLFEENGVNHFAVFSSKEAEQVWQVGKPRSEIMIMGWLADNDLEWAIEQKISFFIFEKDRLEKAIKIAKRKSIKAKIHIELETGMNRTGIEVQLIPDVIALILKNLNFLDLSGICTHYAGAESADNLPRIQHQIQRLNKYLEMFKRENLNPTYVHSACSAASLTYPETQSNMVRAGIMLYGFWPNEETYVLHQQQHNGSGKLKDNSLQMVMKWTSKIMSVKKVPAGDFIGYGSSFRAKQDMVVANVPVGYAYGYSRALSNTGQAIVKGSKVAIIGTINMNSFMIDVSELNDVATGDEVIIIGVSGEERISVASFSESNNQLNYELLSRLPYDIPRDIFY